MVGDTRITMSRTGTTSGLLGGLLKVVILHPNLVLGFAGDSGAALDWIADLEVRPDVPYSIDEVLASARKATDVIDLHLLLAEYRPARVLLVADGIVHDRNDSWAWVGDRDAFAAFQREFASARGTMEASALEHGSASDGGAMVRALESVVESANHPSVGGIVVACFPFKSGFGYSCSFKAVAGGSQSIPSGVPTAVQFGQGAPAGSYSEAILTPTDPGLGVIGIHIREIRRGVLLWPSRFRQRIDYFDCDQLDFATRVQDDHGVAISAPLLQ
jgi:hypothetical protein